jgi:cytidine deaminase
MTDKKTQKKLFRMAMKAATRSYSPYSNFAVGAAALTSNGSIFLGTNVENASYGLTLCAEQTAVANAIANRGGKIAAVAVYCAKCEITPCGGCRQFIAEFGPKVEVIYMANGELVSQFISEMLPSAFTKKDLEK